MQVMQDCEESVRVALQVSRVSHSLHLFGRLHRLSAFAIRACHVLAETELLEQTVGLACH